MATSNWPRPLDLSTSRPSTSRSACGLDSCEPGREEGSIGSCHQTTIFPHEGIRDRSHIARQTFPVPPSHFPDVVARLPSSSCRCRIAGMIFLTVRLSIITFYPSLLPFPPLILTHSSRHSPFLGIRNSKFAIRNSQFEIRREQPSNWSFHLVPGHCSVQAIDKGSPRLCVENFIFDLHVHFITYHYVTTTPVGHLGPAQSFLCFGPEGHLDHQSSQ